MKKCWLMTLGTGLVLLAQITFAGSGSLFQVTASGTPAQVSITLCLNAKGPLSCQTFNVSALNLIITTTIPNHVYPLAGIKINTPGYTLADVGAACTPLNNGMCQFPVSDTASKAIAVSSNSVPQYAYVTNTSTTNSVSNCVINSTTGVLSDCNISTSDLFNDPNSIALNLASARAYITSFSSGAVTLCNIDSISGGLITPCHDTATLSQPRFIALNSAMTRAYVAGGSGVSLYSVASGGELTMVANYNIGDANGIALNPAGTLAYVVLSDDTVQRCGINATTGGLILPCTSTGTGFSGAQRITLNSIGTFAYVTNYGSLSITVCAVDSSSGNLINCSQTAQGVFSGFANMAVNWSNTQAYVPDSDSPTLVSLCSINANGTLSGCTNSGGTGFSGPKGVAVG